MELAAASEAALFLNFLLTFFTTRSKKIKKVTKIVKNTLCLNTFQKIGAQNSTSGGLAREKYEKLNAFSTFFVYFSKFSATGNNCNLGRLASKSDSDDSATPGRPDPIGAPFLFSRNFLPGAKNRKILRKSLKTQCV